MALSGNRVIVDVINYNEVILEQEGALIPDDWCPHKKEACEHRDTKGERYVINES